MISDSSKPVELLLFFCNYYFEIGWKSLYRLYLERQFQCEIPISWELGTFLEIKISHYNIILGSYFVFQANMYFTVISCTFYKTVVILNTYLCKNTDISVKTTEEHKIVCRRTKKVFSNYSQIVKVTENL